ncbi:hypothetical protein ACFFU9_03195 [Mariniflexile ostreae]|uniref:PepSY-associated transmembrane protein n=1 Tax=Mariniflexile ostreae TaxID=1520892 RepID=A0ABV5F8F9_9FLAO
MKNNLSNIKKPGFKTPNNYFENFESNIFKQAKTSNNSGQTGFKVPTSYFDTLENQIMDQVKGHHKTKVIKHFNTRHIVYISSIAAAILLWFTFSFPETSAWDNLDSDTVENYLINEDIGSYEIASTLGSTDFSDYNLKINENSIEIYLLDHTDIEDLLIE